MEIPRVDPVGLVRRPAGWVEQPRRHGRVQRALAGGLLAVFGFVVVATTVLSLGSYCLTSRVDGARHYVVQTLDTIVNNQKTHPITQQSLYSAKASYAMGRADGNLQTGIGPQQTDPLQIGNGFQSLVQVVTLAADNQGVAQTQLVLPVATPTIRLHWQVLTYPLPAALPLETSNTVTMTVP